ncbi:DNA-dependent metalloprotease SPRTN isoform X2 [Anthonomus grandis grandis]|uniref:DNA-dependent metalloprotease SPRTN isoform X2 n=1 Tax=Anthonomus grandis grandis TaxID=2921223 RepID=UPI002165DA4B|nr:DNA-dependent metalloprotease SPRTN isoform X2 [Anthonomus grandis grandis]XP_050293687.1 DNA-dependent metalloprotease SPRTN isoform X2 [Anthonomus grandis grandis]
MAELDYQMALLLQYKFEQEHKHKENTDSDLQLALELQEQFKQEEEVQRPKNNLVYKNTKANDSKCLVDPSWEVIDPTPDVHVLFITFNKRFFWDKLGSVTVSWSKRMTSCAGICSYQGRGGMCSITLSEPLLKLRPRKDLVETLLHEMIHAYLFVTHNNRDRDGHGPEFHKHMYRINGEAGTNISVYHDFHDEVRLYQQHWWRCDGPCQHQKPYFGTVRRASNRAPGPNDRWWEEHKRNCGGNFIKDVPNCIKHWFKTTFNLYNQRPGCSYSFYA